MSSAEYRGNLLAVAHDDDAPTAVWGAGQALKVARLARLLAVDFLDDVSALEAEIAGIRAGIDIDDRNSFVNVLQLPLFGERRRKIGHLHPGKWLTGADNDLIARCR